MFDSLPVLIPVKINTKLKTIAPIRCREVFLGIPKKVEGATDLQWLLLVRKYDICTEASRRECVGCEINGRVIKGCAQR